MRVIDTSDRGEHAQRFLAETNPMWNSMMRDTIAPTILQAGFRGNVIPSEAHAVLNIRLLPGDTIDVLVNELKKLVNDPQVHFEIAPEGGLAAPHSSLDNNYFSLILRVCVQGVVGVPGI